MAGRATETMRQGRGTWRELAVLSRMVRKERLTEEVEEPKPEAEERRKHVKQAGVC